MTQNVEMPRPEYRPLSFAVGCFHFGLRMSPPFRLSEREYADKVTAALNKLPSINNVEVALEADDDDSCQIMTELPSLKEDGEFSPFPHFLSVSFDLFIPLRIQSDLLKAIGPGLRTETESFRVDLTHEYHCPVTFVRPLNQTHVDSPSTSVVVVREFLYKELNAANSDISFEVLGPSPFHGEFVLGSAQATDGGLSDPFSIDIQHPRGYAEILISYDSALFGSSDEAFEQVRTLLADELDLFYEINRVDLQALHAWSALQTGMSDLLANKDLNFLGRVKRLFSRSARIHKTHQKLAEFDATRIFSQQALDESFRNTYWPDSSQFLRSLLEKEMKGRAAFPTEQIGRLLAFVEDRRSKVAELMVVLLAAVIGGAAGSLFTILAS